MPYASLTRVKEGDESWHEATKLIPSFTSPARSAYIHVSGSSHCICILKRKWKCHVPKYDSLYNYKFMSSKDNVGNLPPSATVPVPHPQHDTSTLSPTSPITCFLLYKSNHISISFSSAKRPQLKSILEKYPHSQNFI